MRFVMTANGLAPSDGALIPELIEKGTEKATEAVTMALINKGIYWVQHIGLPMLSEGLLVWSMFCILMAITGRDRWMERGIKSFVGFVLVRVAYHAV
jgi:hypothetical protein